jgi:hypothetical protein
MLTQEEITIIARDTDVKYFKKGDLQKGLYKSHFSL